MAVTLTYYPPNPSSMVPMPPNSLNNLELVMIIVSIFSNVYNVDNSCSIMLFQKAESRSELADFDADEPNTAG